MKKITVIILAVGLVFACGCTGYRELNRGYIVSAVGFKKQEGQTLVFAEALSPTETAENTKETEILSGEGETVLSAYRNLIKNSDKETYFEQCAAVAVETSFDTDEIYGILEVCKNIPSLNVGAYIIKTDDVKSLFEVDGTTGYDVVGLIKYKSKSENIKFSNQIYKAERDVLKNGATKLPQVNARDGKYILYTNESGKIK